MKTAKSESDDLSIKCQVELLHLTFFYFCYISIN